MANALYNLAKKSFLDGDFTLLTDNLKVLLVDTGTYTVNLSTHQFHSDVSGIVATSGNLGTKTTTDGTFDSADFTFTAVSGASSEALILYADSGVSSTSRLIAYIDTGTGLPVTPNGGDIDVTVNGSGWFSI